jgi:hypothetical protein
MVVLTVSGCADDPVIKECHDMVHLRSKNSAKIISTNTVDSRKGGGLIRIEGRAQLQNGFGAWSNYQYFCDVYGKSIVSFSLDEGWQ